MWRLYLIAAGCLALLCVFVYYWFDEKVKDKDRKKRDHINKTWTPKPGFNDEFAGRLPGTCGQVRAGEWQCNCADQTKPCSTLLLLKSQVEKDEEKANMTDRRGAIAAQKRKKNGR
ncbi:unnamed protein product [marine sediment metagenome]|uniref:Uncharacterized protein n=1 Tax=marine sediment metagenome TaxID=412755 RepID=X0VP54_9ZZZZ